LRRSCPRDGGAGENADRGRLLDLHVAAERRDAGGDRLGAGGEEKVLQAHLADEADGAAFAGIDRARLEPDEGSALHPGGEARVLEQTSGGGPQNANGALRKQVADAAEGSDQRGRKEDGPQLLVLGEIDLLLHIAQRLLPGGDGDVGDDIAGASEHVGFTELAAEGDEAVLVIGLAADANPGVASERKGSKIDRVPG
jgi:hypothetical protein